MTEHHDTDPSPTFTPHWADDLFGHIDEVLDVIGQATRECPIRSVELAKKLDLGWEEIWAIVCHLQSVAVPVRNDGYGFWLGETMADNGESLMERDALHATGGMEVDQRIENRHGRRRYVNHSESAAYLKTTEGRVVAAPAPRRATLLKLGKRSSWISMRLTMCSNVTA